MDSADRIVVAQVLALAGHLWPGRARWGLPRAVVVGATGTTAVGGLASIAAALPHGRALTPRVTPPTGAQLITDGPYRWSRNPIYAGLLVATAGFAVLRRRPEPALAWAALLTVLSVKARHEERALGARFGEEYERYRERTPRFVGLARPSG